VNRVREFAGIGWVLFPVPVFGVVVVAWWVLAEVRLIRHRDQIRAMVERRRADRRAARTRPAGAPLTSRTSLVDAAGGAVVTDDTPLT
jgi:hypothetical protein